MADEILLRNVIADDLPVLFEQQTDAEAVRMAAFPSRDRETFMAHWAKLLADDALTLKTIVCKSFSPPVQGGAGEGNSDAQVAGYISSWEQDGRRLVAYWIGRNFWGRKIASQALAEFGSLAYHAGTNRYSSMLTDFQKRIAEYIATETLSVALGSHNDPRDKGRLKAAGFYAYALYCDLRSSGHTLEFSALMIKNRGLDPSNPLFFMHVSPLTDLVHMVSKLTSSAAQPATTGATGKRMPERERVEAGLEGLMQ